MSCGRDENRVAARLVNLFVTTDSSSVSLLDYTHPEESFPFSPQHASLLFIILFHFSHLSAFHLLSCVFLFVPVSCTSVIVSFPMGGPGWFLLSNRGGNARPVGQ